MLHASVTPRVVSLASSVPRASADGGAAAGDGRDALAGESAGASGWAHGSGEGVVGGVGGGAGMLEGVEGRHSWARPWLDVRRCMFVARHAAKALELAPL